MSRVTNLGPMQITCSMSESLVVCSRSACFESEVSLSPMMQIVPCCLVVAWNWFESDREPRVLQLGMSGEIDESEPLWLIECARCWPISEEEGRWWC